MSGHAWPCMAIYGRTWPYMAMYGHAWPDMAMYKINENPKSKISFRCVKLRENPENLGFTFFAVLPIYLNVSDSLAYSKRRGLKRSIVWYKKLLISCLVACYSAVFVFNSMEIHGCIAGVAGILPEKKKQASYSQPRPLASRYLDSPQAISRRFLFDV